MVDGFGFWDLGFGCGVKGICFRVSGFFRMVYSLLIWFMLYGASRKEYGKSTIILIFANGFEPFRPTKR
jgi:hypothetical protein